MKYILQILCLLVGFSSLGQTTHESVKNEIIVKFKTYSHSTNLSSANFNSVTLRPINALVAVSKIHEIKRKIPSNTFVLKFENDSYTIDQVISLYKETGLFEYIEPNFIGKGSGVASTIPNDTHYDNQWGLYNDGTFQLSDAVSGADINMQLAWDIEKGDPDLIVAIIDSGVRMVHPEFAGRVWTNENEIQDGIDNDGNGFVDDLIGGWDFINNDNEPIDDHGHGTNVAGIAMATGDNDRGFAGVNWNSKMMVCKALNSNNSGTYSAMAESIYYAVDNGAKVINMSIGGSSQSFTLSSAIDYCYENGVVLVACMMNFDNDITYYPAGFENTIAVGSTDPDDTRTDPFFWSATSGSNFGEHIDLVAPGNYMYGLDYQNDWWYSSYWGGTSQATPLVAGVVSLLFSQNPNLTFEDIRQILAESSEDQVGDSSEDIAGFDIYHGNGRLNAYRALMNEIVNVEELPVSKENIALYPNPLQRGSELTISNLPTSRYSIDIFDALGRSVYQNQNFEVGSSSIKIPAINLAGGSYFLRLKDLESKQTIGRKLMVE
ncbi:MAG: S8 family serine peptidase [Bacteroidota bacterium]